MNLKRISNSSDLKPYLESPLYQGFLAERLDQEAVNEHLLLLEHDSPVARCSLWWQETPKYKQHDLGLIGHYAAQSDEAAQLLLEHALTTLKKQNCSLAVGPMDGSTWRSYRFVTHGDAPAFLLEPTHPASYPLQWQEAGFEPLAEYFSAMQGALLDSPDLKARLQDLSDKGISIRSLNKEMLDVELGRIFDLTLQSFTQNFLYTPLGKMEVLAQYKHILPYILKELVLIAEHKNETIAYLFALPDLAQQQRGEKLDTFIIKTLVTHPNYTGQGIATILTALVMQEAKALGFQKVIHALMISDNHSRKISQHYQQKELRRYALYAKTL